MMSPAQAPAGRKKLLTVFTGCLHADARADHCRGKGFQTSCSKLCKIASATLSEMARQAALAVASNVVRSHPKRWYLSLGSSSAELSSEGAAVGRAPDAPKLPCLCGGADAAGGVTVLRSDFVSGSAAVPCLGGSSVPLDRLLLVGGLEPSCDAGAVAAGAPFAGPAGDCSLDPLFAAAEWPVPVVRPPSVASGACSSSGCAASVSARFCMPPESGDAVPMRQPA
jgi:hypothetical protein